MWVHFVSTACGCDSSSGAVTPRCRLFAWLRRERHQLVPWRRACGACSPYGIFAPKRSSFIVSSHLFWRLPSSLRCSYTLRHRCTYTCGCMISLHLTKRTSRGHPGTGGICRLTLSFSSLRPLTWRRKDTALRREVGLLRICCCCVLTGVCRV